MTDDKTFDQLMQPYRNDMDQIALGSDAKEHLVSALLAKDSTVQPEPVFSDGSRTIRRFPRRARMAAALIAAAFVVLTGFTVSTQGQELWRQLFGNDEAAEHIAPVDARSTDSGITMEVTSAVSDADHTYFLLRVTGLPKEGIDDADLTAIVDVNGEMVSSTNGRMVAFDEQTGALDYVVVSNDWIPAGSQVDMRVFDVSDWETQYDVVVDEGSVSQLLKESGSADYRDKPDYSVSDESGELVMYGESQHDDPDEPGAIDTGSVKEVLVAGSTDLPVAQTNKVSVVGMDRRNGILHVLTESSDGALGKEYAYLENPLTGEYIEPDGSVSYFYGEDWDGLDQLHEKGQMVTPHRLFTDWVFFVRDESKLDQMQLKVRGDTGAWDKSGAWDLSFTMPSSESPSILEGRSNLECKGFGTIERAFITPFCVGFDVLNAPEGEQYQVPQIDLVYRDGSSVAYRGQFDNVTAVSSAAMERGDQTVASFGAVKNYEDIVALEVNGMRIDLS